ncbi:MAG: chromosome segregation SMC family protein [Brevinema sp.]
MSIYLKSLEISGFKSFGMRTYIEFSEGITGIVGPNGCGKSNVVESMKWVLGEQSAKSLRGEKMQDIIFAGTQHRSASGMADVSLTFNNENKWLPLEFPEVAVGRRVFRSGEGQYFVNGVRSRLKDTTELFLDTGVGRDSYAIFEQGKIDRLLSESAEDRRILFEDFAGISKFKFRKEEAEKKLAQARENLERLQETIDRLESDIHSLELQAQDAENYNTVNAELRKMEIKFELARIENMSKEITRRENELTKLKDSLLPASQKLSEIEEQMKLSDASLGDKESLFSKLNEKNINLEKELSESKIRYESAEKNLRSNQQRLQELTLRFRQDQERLEDWEETLTEKEEAYTDAEKKQEQAKIILDKAEQTKQLCKERSDILEQKLLDVSKEYGFTIPLNRDNIDQIRKNISELQAQIYMQESTIISLENEINNKKQLFEEEKGQSLELKKQFEGIQSQQTGINNTKQSLLAKIQGLEQEILSYEQDYKQIIEALKECDKKVLQNMDLNALKDFQSRVGDCKGELTGILNSMERLIREKQLIPQELFTQFRDLFTIYDTEYDLILGGVFGEGFAEKMILSEQLDQKTSLAEQSRGTLVQFRIQLDKITIQERGIFQKTAEAELLYKNSEKEYLKLEKNITQLSHQLVQAQTVFELEKSQMQTNQSKLEKMEKIVSDYDKELSAIRQQSYQHQEEFSNARIDFNSTETQTKSLLKDIKSLEERITDYKRQIDVMDHDKNQCQKTINTLQEEIEDLLLEQDELKPSLEDLKKEMEQHFHDIADLRQAKRVLEQMHKDGIEQYTKLRMRESEIEGSLSERKASFETMKNSIQEQFGLNHMDITLQKEESLELIGEQIRVYRERLNQMGNVNLLAIEQFQTAKEYYAQLVYQKEDVESATEDTEMLINETNKESAERFLTAFEQIRKSFRTLFSELFNGGKADLILRDKSDPLRSGIDIMAEPPGQKFQNVSLLSGGQRAMVAIAVIFSILELKPTPFVILDEMDAPLDDENIDRFKRLLVRFKGKSQFVVVSHSKSTLEVCDVLFGVTMEELGCSKIMSVAFDDSENLVFA